LLRSVQKGRLLYNCPGRLPPKLRQEILREAKQMARGPVITDLEWESVADPCLYDSDEPAGLDPLKQLQPIFSPVEIEGMLGQVRLGRTRKKDLAEGCGIRERAFRQRRTLLCHSHH